MKLVFLTANNAWVFMFHDQIIRMGDGVMFHATRNEARAAAKACGLVVTFDNQVVIAP